MKAIEGAVYCQKCVARLSGRTSMNLIMTYPASHDKSKCHGADTYKIPSTNGLTGACLGEVVICSKCNKPCEIEVNKGTCRGCGETVELRAASKVIKREMVEKP